MSEETPADAPLESIARKTLTDVRALLGLGVALLVSIFGGGWAAFAQVRSEAKEAAAETTAGLQTEQKALKANVDDLRGEVTDLKDEVRGLRRDLRVLFPFLPDAGGVKDAGQ